MPVASVPRGDPGLGPSSFRITLIHADPATPGQVVADVVLTEAGGQKIAVIKEVRSPTSLGLRRHGRTEVTHVFKDVTQSGMTGVVAPVAYAVAAVGSDGRGVGPAMTDDAVVRGPRRAFTWVKGMGAGPMAAVVGYGVGGAAGHYRHKCLSPCGRRHPRAVTPGPAHAIFPVAAQLAAELF